MKLLLTALISVLMFAQPSPVTRVSGSKIRILTRTSTSTTDTISQADCGTLISYSNPGAVAVTLPAATALLNGCWMDVQNSGAGTVTITPNNSAIDGAASIALTTNQGVRIVDATNQYLTQRGQGSGGGNSGGAAPYSADGATLSLNGAVFSANTAVIATRALATGGSDNTCVVSSGSSSAYVGAMAGNVLTVYTDGMSIRVSIDVTTAGTAITLDCGGGAKSVFQNDGATNPTSSQWAGGSYQTVVYSGAKNAGAGAWVLQSSGGGGGAIDTDYIRYFTTSNLIGNSITLSNSFQSYASTNPTGNFNANGGLTGAELKATGAPDYIQWLGKIPSSGWTGGIALKVFWTLRPDSSGAGTGSHTYQAACFTPGVSSTQSGYQFPSGAGASTVSFNFAGGKTYIGTVDMPVLALPSCAADDILILRMTRNVTGTATDNTVVVYFDVSLPRTVQ